MEDTARAGSNAQIIDPSYFDAPSGHESVENDRNTLPNRGIHLAWEAWVRCIFILLMLALVGLLTWRPGLARLTMIFSLVSPSRGERLAWRAVDDPIPMPPPAKKLPPPPEWRLGSTHAASWTLNRPGPAVIGNLAGIMASGNWRRITDNAWSWWDDAVRFRKDDEARAEPPPQKSMTAYRVGDLAAWPLPVFQTAATPAADQPFFTIPALPDVPRSPAEASVTGAGELPPLPAAHSESQPLFPGLPPLPAPAASGLAATNPVVPPGPSGNPSAKAPSLLPPGDGMNAGFSSVAGKTEEIDWKTREITGPIPDAYLIIYPKLRFVGLCVPGQGYIRKYNQVGVPRELEGAKLRADDGRVPYGRYYVAERYMDSDGPRLFLSWPSPEDARRAGLDAGKISLVDNAWKRLDLPPQDTQAGGGVGLNGLRQWVEKTDGGFSLEASDMEEIYTALPDKAKVLIQP